MDGLLAGVSVQVFIAATLTSMAAAILVLLLMRRYAVAAGARRLFLPEAVSDQERIWVFKDHSLHTASDADRKWLNAASGVADPFTGLQQLLPPEGQTALERLVQDGIPFSSSALTADGCPWILTGDVRGHVFVLKIQPDMTAGDTHAYSKSVASEIVETAPMPIWKTDQNGALLWANSAFNLLTGGKRLGEALEAPFFVRPDKAVADSRTAHLTVQDQNDAIRTYRATHSPSNNGSTLSFGTDISRQIEAEAGMSRFLTTMAETFAHLPIGMAVFNGEGALRVFNPALVDLIGLEPGWLAGEPSIDAFFDALRENRIMPEEPNKKAWRKRVKAIENQSRADVWCEQWDLANGQCIKATGRSHPNDAVAFLFEDVTINSTLKRKYRAELEQSQVTLKHLNDAVAVFDPAGRLAFCNPAFLSTWRLSQKPETVRQVSQECAALCQPNDDWAKLRTFVTSSEDRSVWMGDFKLLDDRQITGRFAPLPDGATLAIFAEKAVARPRATPNNALAKGTKALAQDIIAQLPQSLQADERNDLAASIMGLWSLTSPDGLDEHTDLPLEVARLATLMGNIPSQSLLTPTAKPKVQSVDGNWQLVIPIQPKSHQKDRLPFRIFARVCAIYGAEINMCNGVLECTLAQVVPEDIPERALASAAS